MNQLTLFSTAEASGKYAPIPAKCRKCGWDAVGRNAVSAPSLAACFCYWCLGPLRAHRGERDFAIADNHEETKTGMAWEKYLRIEGLCNYGVVPAGTHGAKI